MKPHTSKRLSVVDHDRDAVGKRYVYAVVSRRSGGVSVGINLNPNNACNWRCVYCQVPELSYGKGPKIDLGQLDSELRDVLEDVIDGDFMQRRVPEGARTLADVAFSGNGEPTTSPQLAEAVEVVAAALARHQLVGELPVVLISNGTMMGKSAVQRVLRRIGELGGQIWFKLDSATEGGAQAIHGTPLALSRHLQRLRIAASLCDTWIQTCMFALDGAPPADAEIDAYLATIASLAGQCALKGVQLYSLARPSQQPEAPRLSRLPRAWLEQLGRRIEAAGLPTRVVVD